VIVKSHELRLAADLDTKGCKDDVTNEFVPTPLLSTISLGRAEDLLCLIPGRYALRLVLI